MPTWLEYRIWCKNCIRLGHMIVYNEETKWRIGWTHCSWHSEVKKEVIISCVFAGGTCIQYEVSHHCSRGSWWTPSSTCTSSRLRPPHTPQGPCWGRWAAGPRSPWCWSEGRHKHMRYESELSPTVAVIQSSYIMKQCSTNTEDNLRQKLTNWPFQNEWLWFQTRSALARLHFIVGWTN